MVLICTLSFRGQKDSRVAAQGMLRYRFASDRDLPACCCIPKVSSLYIPLANLNQCFSVVDSVPCIFLCGGLRVWDVGAMLQ